MLFRITGEALKRNKTVPILVGTGRTRIAYGVGDTWLGWLSDRRERKLSLDVRRKLKWNHDIGYYCHVLEHGKWEVVSYYNDL